MKRTLLVGLTLALAPVLVVSAARRKDPFRRYAGTARELYSALETLHITRRAPDDMISRRAWTNCLDACDGTRMVFVADDIAAFAKSERLLDDQLRTGSFAFIRTLRDTYLARLVSCVTFATNVLATTAFDFSAEGEWLDDRRNAPWPATVGERERLWRERLRSEVLDEFLACETGGVKAAAAKVSKRLVGELNAARQRSVGEICQAFFLAMVSAYDAHSIFLNDEMFDSFRSEMDLTFCGIGAEWELKDGYPRVRKVMPGGPLRRDGHVRAGDTILAVAPKGLKKSKLVPLEGKSMAEISRLFKGEKGSSITLEVRSSQGKVARYTITRDKIQMEDSAASSAVVQVDVAGQRRPLGYLRLPSFYQAMDNSGRSCAEDLRNELLKLRKANVSGVVFDLRDNGGGSLEDAVKIIGCFVQTGPAVRMVGPTGDVTLPVLDGGAVCEVPVLVLTSSSSASAGELVPGTLRDLGRAVIAGDVQTFGKGSAQGVHQLSGKHSGAAIITDSRFYRLTGESTQLEGVKSDLHLPSPVFGEGQESERMLSYPLPGDCVERSDFSPAWDLNTFIPELKAASERRLSRNAKWAAYLKLVKRSHERAERKTLPLSQRSRSRLNAADDQLDDDLEALDERRFNPNDREGDPVLDEAFRIAADLVRLNGGRTLPQPQRKSAAASLLGGLDDD